MELITTRKELRKRLESLPETATVGFVPTMGALHRGHISLVNKAVKENNTVVVSIFVNPTQFNDVADLERYPRNLKADSEILASTGCKWVYAPAPEDIYPEPDTRVFSFDGLDVVMEGKYRPGHFNGVAQVVSRLFHIVKPCKAYFGLKDFQQLAIIRHITESLKLPVEIVACPTVREENGLAMSSRNELLTATQRSEAPIIYNTLKQGAKMKGSLPVAELEEWMAGEINKNTLFRVEYIQIVDANSLQPIQKWSVNTSMVACAAVWCGNIRLIDNILF